MRLKPLLTELAVMLAIAIVIAALGPFGSYQIGGFGKRLAYWLPASLVGFAIFRPIAAAAQWSVRDKGISMPVALIGATLVAAIPGTVAMLLLAGRMRAQWPDADALFGLYTNVALLGGLILALFVFIERRSGMAADEVTASQLSRSPFLDRLPPSWNDQLQALEMEDHYLRLHGPDGASELILMRMGDAERELDTVAGARVHRSWWVARDAVVGRRREGRNLLLQLKSGIEAPVARDRVAALRAAGWLQETGSSAS